MATPVQTITGITIPLATFTRPADTNAYASGDLVANSTTAGSVVPLSWSIGASTSAKSYFYVTGVRLKLDNATLTNAQFRVHIYNAAPAVATTGDNGVYGTVVSGNANWLGSYDITMATLHADGVVGIAVPTEGEIAPQHITGLAPGSPVTIYGLIEARAAYTPKSGGVFTAELMVEVS